MRIMIRDAWKRGEIKYIYIHTLTVGVGISYSQFIGSFNLLNLCSE